MTVRVVFLLAIAAAAMSCGDDDDDEDVTPADVGDETDAERAVELAREAYDEAVAAGVDLSNGPCISEDLQPGWVADIAHDPRQEIDNDPANQCQSFLNGEAEHFVELDPEGNLIEAR